MNQRSSAGPAADAFLGGTWAALLATALLVALSAEVADRWTAPPQAREEIVQLPVPTIPPTPREEPTAPDPGDNP